MNARAFFLVSAILLAGCGHKTDLRLLTPEEEAKRAREDSEIPTTRHPVNRNATQLPPAPRF